MISSVVSSLVYSKKLKVLEIFPPRLRELWKEWDLRVFVLLSLTLQVVLIILGHRRKFNHRLWIRVVVWCAYLASDYIATCALGALSNNLADIYDEDDGGSLDANIELTALWAPFLLLHLGGPDTITAYSLEDNELWLRHLLGLIVQTGVTVYVFLMAWTGSHLSVLFIIMFLAGFVKYGERTWVLRSVSNEKRTAALPVYHVFSPRNTNFLHEQKIKEREGYNVAVENFTEIKLPVDLPISISRFISDEDKLVAAYCFFNNLTKSFFLDATLSSSDGDSTRNFFRNMSSENAFRITEIELGLTYDLLYTKAPLLYTPVGLCLRLITFLLTCSVLLLFPLLDDKHKYSRVDFLITCLLLVVGVILEIYAAFLLVSSDQFLIWSSMHNNTSTVQSLISFPWFNRPRWSNNMSQYSFVGFINRENPLPCYNILKLLNLDKELENPWNVAHKDVPKEIKDKIFRYVRSKASGGYQEASITRGEHEDFTLGKCPNLKEELGKSILFWHIVTEVLYYLYREDIKKLKGTDEAFVQTCKSSKQISRYMMYLLLVHPSMLSGTNQIIFEDTVDEAVEILEHQRQPSKLSTCDLLIGKAFKDEPNESTRVFSLLPQALRCAGRIKQQPLLVLWKKIWEGWLEILTHAASKCKGNEHAQQLKNGGELLTHVSLLMAHFGLTHHFQVSEKPQIARLIAK